MTTNKDEASEAPEGEGGAGYYVNANPPEIAKLQAENAALQQQLADAQEKAQKAHKAWNASESQWVYMASALGMSWMTTHEEMIEKAKEARAGLTQLSAAQDHTATQWVQFHQVMSEALGLDFEPNEDIERYTEAIKELKATRAQLDGRDADVKSREDALARAHKREAALQKELAQDQKARARYFMALLHIRDYDASNDIVGLADIDEQATGFAVVTKIASEALEATAQADDEKKQ